MKFIALKETFFDRKVVRQGEAVFSQENLAKTYPSIFRTEAAVVEKPAVTRKVVDNKVEKPVVE